jgi:hypothetical protein
MKKSDLRATFFELLRSIYRVLKRLRSCNKAVIEVEKKSFFYFLSFLLFIRNLGRNLCEFFICL